MTICFLKLRKSLFTICFLLFALCLSHAQIEYRKFSHQLQIVYPSVIAAKDMNGDGFKDIIIAGSYFNLGILFNKGDGTYDKPIFYEAENTAHRIAIEDINNDGRPDVILGASQGVSVYLNIGNGTLAAKTIYETPYPPRDLACVDVNGDSRLDLISFNTNATLSVFTNTGSGVFTSRNDLTLSNNSLRKMSFNDFNGDGKVDIAFIGSRNSTITSTGTVLLMTNTGSGSFNAFYEYPIGNNPNYIASGDINGDGFNDVLVTNTDDNTLSVLTNLGTGALSPRINYATDLNPYDVRLSDFNGDGKLDVVVAHWGAESIGVYTNSGFGQLSPYRSYTTEKSPFGLFAEDINNDTSPDVLVVGGNYNFKIQVLTNTGSGIFSDRYGYTTAMDIRSYESVDMNGDENKEIVVYDVAYNGLRVFEPSGNGTLLETSTIQFPPCNCGSNFKILDIDSNGTLEVLVLNPDSTHVLSVTGMHTYSIIQTLNYDAGASKTDWEVIDINGDSLQDLLILSLNRLHVYTNTGTGNFSNYMLQLTSYIDLEKIEVGDINNDSKPDLAISSFWQNAVYVFTNTGTGLFVETATITPNYFPFDLKLGDVNGDLKPDIILNNSVSDLFTVFTNSGLGSFNDYIEYSLDNAFAEYDLNVADFNQDGLIDVTIRELGSDYLKIFTSTGLGGFGNYKEFELGPYAVVLNLSDLNKDGAVDIFAASHNTGFFGFMSKINVLTVTALNASKIYGMPNPEFTYSISGAYYGDVFDVSFILEGDQIIPSVSGIDIGNYRSIVTVSGILNVLPANQTIVGFIGVPILTVGGLNHTITGVSATSGLEVSYTSSNLSVISVVGQTLMPISEGVVTITAFQNGNNQYNPANTVEVLAQVIAPAIPAGTKIEEAMQEVNIYPNPNTIDLVHVLGAWVGQTISIRNVYGDILYTQQVKSNLEQIQIAHLNPGVYWFVVGLKTFKFIKQ